jgi:CRP-like cAMP-binding protein
LENDETKQENSQTVQESTDDVGPISPNSTTPGTQARRSWKPKRKVPVEQRSLENNETKRENSQTAQESTEDVGPISPNSTIPGTQARRSWKAKRGVSVEQTSLDNDETKRQNSLSAKESTEEAVPISPSSISKLRAFDRPDTFDSLTMPDKVRRSWKPKRNFSIQHENAENDDTEEEKSNGTGEKEETPSDKAGSGMSQTPSISEEGDEGAIISARLSFKDRRAMFSKVTTPPADLMRKGRPGFLNPKHIKKLVVKPEREGPEPVNRPVREMLPIVNESQLDTSEGNQKISLDKANEADESVSNRVEKFNNFHDRRSRLRATKSARGFLGQKSASQKNMFKACRAPVEDFNAFEPPTFSKDGAEIKIIKVALKKNFVFHDLEEQDMERFVAAFQQVNFSKGDAIIKQGDVGGYFYVVANGEVSFHVNNKHVGVTGKGNAFGELSLLYTCPRAATVTALTQPTSLFRVDPKSFHFLMQSQTKKSGEEKLKLLSDISFLLNLGDEDIMRLYSVMTPLLFCTGDLIVRKGDQGNSFYILQEGRVRVTDIYVGNTSYENVTLEPGDYFGEGSLVSNEPRPANVVALTKGMAFSIDRGQFEKVLGDFPRLVSKAQDRQRLECIKVLKDADLTSTDLDSLVKHIADKDFSSNETIFRQIDEIQAALYIVREGVVRITTEDGSRTEDIGAGGYFGQEQLLVDSKGLQDSTCMVSAEYTATVSSDKCTCGILSLEECRAVFDTTSMGDGVFGGGITELQIKRASIRASIAANVGLHDLRKDFILGEGQFGEVWLVKADPHGTQNEEFMQEFALKIQAKDDPVRKNNVIEAIKREMTVVLQLNHPFIIDLVETYECDAFIYMLMEAVKGGELWSVIHQEGEDGNWTSGLTESHTKFYSMILADTLAYMHRQKFIFRDLKPENVLIDTEGYPIIVDFGFAKYCPDKTYTFCGTPNYLAPEIVMNRGHGAGVDHWALGVVTYEMITGENPFYFEDMDQMTLFQAIVQERFYPLPETATPELNKFITGLLEKEPNQRLGSLAGREKDILRHAWFAELDFDKMRNKEAKAPWLPTITD